MAIANSRGKRPTKRLPPARDVCFGRADDPQPVLADRA
jgi:hypothetical protein